MKIVRRMHMYASDTGLKKGVGFISQMEVAMTTFGFAGFVINRPHLFGIESGDRAKREGFIHFWAVMNHMLGVHERFNICLLPLEAVELEFDIIMRNVLGPYLQVETKLFRKMVKVLVKGMQTFIPTLDYETQMFLTRRAVGIPGYQFRVDMDKEVPHRNLFTEDDLRRMHELYPRFSKNIVIYKVRPNKKSDIDRCEADLNNNHIYNSNNNTVDEGSGLMTGLEYDTLDPEVMRHLMGLPCTSVIVAKEVARDSDDFKRHLNENQYHKLSARTKISVNISLMSVDTMHSAWGKYLMELLLDYSMAQMRASRGKPYQR